MGAMQICGAGLAAAQSGGDPNSHVGVALKLTTLGIGIEAAVPVAERLNVRAGFNVFTLNPRR
jgi:hypothetical protein